MLSQSWITRLSRTVRPSPFIQVAVVASISILGLLIKEAARTEEPQGPGRRLQELSILSTIFGEDCQTDVEYGLVVGYILGCIYIFFGLAILCDGYFVNSLILIGDTLHLSDDVQGATLMAAGSSAPELFTALIGVFLTENDIGIGTIVGSTIFNLLCIVGGCGVIAGKTLYLDWRPYARDSFFYALSILWLLISFLDVKVYWYESLVFVLIYAAYTMTMVFNKWVMRGLDKIQACLSCHICHMHLHSAHENTHIGEAIEVFVEGHTPGDTELPKSPDSTAKPSRLSHEIEVVQIVSTPSAHPVVRGIADAFLNDVNIQKGSLQGLRKSMDMTRTPASPPRVSIDLRRVGMSAINNSGRRGMRRQSGSLASPTASPMSAGRGGSIEGNFSISEDAPTAVEMTDLEKGKEGTKGKKHEREKAEEGAPQPRWKVVLKKIWKVTFLFISLPFDIAFGLTIPDCKKKCLKYTYPVTFVMSIVWLGILCFLLIDMASRAGCVLGLSNAIMGLTFLAVGTSVPDGLGGLLVAMDGKGDMAVANALGSNVFDVCFALAFPWFLKTAFVEPGGYVEIGKEDGEIELLLYTFFLFMSLLLVTATFMCTGFRLKAATGALFLGAYGAFIIFAFVWVYAIFPVVPHGTI